MYYIRCVKNFCSNDKQVFINHAPLIKLDYNDHNIQLFLTIGEVRINPKVFDAVSQVGGGFSVVGGFLGFLLASYAPDPICPLVGPCPPAPDPVTWMIYGAIPGAVLVIGKLIWKSIQGDR